MKITLFEKRISKHLLILITIIFIPKRLRLLLLLLLLLLRKLFIAVIFQKTRLFLHHILYF